MQGVLTVLLPQTTLKRGYRRCKGTFTNTIGLTGLRWVLYYGKVVVQASQTGMGYTLLHF